MSQGFALVALLLLTFLPALSCAENAGGQSATQSGMSEVPEWVKDPTSGGKIFGAYGVSDRHLQGEKAQRRLAMMGARVELSAFLTSKILAVTKDWIRENGTVSASNANLNMSIEKMARECGSTLISEVKNQWMDATTGKMFIHIVLSNSKENAKAAKKAVRANPEIKDALSAANADQAYAKFDAMIDKLFQEEKTEKK